MLRIAAALFVTVALAAQESPAVLARLPADTSNLLVVRDVLPHIDAALASSLVRDLLAATDTLQDEMMGQHFDAATLAKQLGLIRRFVPSEIVVAAPPTAASALVNLLRGMYATVLLMRMTADERQQDDAKELASMAAADLQAVQRLDLQASLRMRDERTAESWFDSVEQWLGAQGLGAQGLGDGFALTVHDGELTVHVRPSVLGDGAVAHWLSAAGVEFDPKWNPTFRATLKQAGPVLSLQLGEPAAGPLPAKALGRLWSEDTGALLFARLDWGPDGERLLEFMEQLQPFAESSREATASMATRLLAELSLLGDSVWAPRTIALRIDDAVTYTVEEDVGDEAEQELQQPATQVVRCLAPDSGPFSLLALPLDVVVASAIDEWSTQFARRGYVLPEQWQPVIDFFFGEESSAFEPGTLFVTSAAQFRGGPDWVHGAMPFAAGAVLAKCIDEDSANAFMADLSQRVGASLALEGPLWVDQELAPGVPSHGLDLARHAPQLAAMQLDFDFSPHWFVLDTVLVLSTDPKLSARIVERLRGTEPAAAPFGNLISWSCCTGGQVADLCAGAARWVAVVPTSEPMQPRMPLLLRTLAALANTVDGIESRLDLDGSVLRDVMTLRLKRSK